MKALLIPPVRELGSFAHPAKMHLLLSHLVPIKAYWQFYINRKIAGDYLILDNSAHEFRKPVDPEKLIADAKFVRADEIVMPDIPYDSAGTLKATRECLEHWTKYNRKELSEMQPRLMLVPQGSTLQEWRTCLFGLILTWTRKSKEFPELFGNGTEKPVIALPAKYQGKFPGADIAELLRNWLHPLNDNGFKIHLLGWRELWRLNALALEFPWIRSIDSAKPFVYGLKGIMFDPINEAEPGHVDRPDDYFELTFKHPHQLLVAKHNVEVFTRLAKGGYKQSIMEGAK